MRIDFPLFVPVAMMMLWFGVSPATADDIAVSLVHDKGRVDIPVSAIRKIEAYSTFSIFVLEKNETREYPSPRVELCYMKDIQSRICRLTRQIVDQPMEIVVDCEVISKPVVREPLCATGCLHIAVADVAYAKALAERLRHGSNRACTPAS